MGFVKLLGVPYSVGCRAETATAIDQQNGPRAIRDALRAYTSQFSIIPSFEDAGDIKVKPELEEVLAATEQAVTEIVKKGDIPFLIGGSHTISLGTLRAVAQSHPGFSLIYIDAHPDIVPRPQINYGSVNFHALKEELVTPDRIAMLGVRQIEDSEYKIMEEQNIFHLHAHEMSVLGIANVLKQVRDRLPAPYVISFDLDSVDPSFAPGVTSPYPCGLTSSETQGLLDELCTLGVIAFEMVEMSPINDRNEETAKLAASIILRTTRILGSRNRAN